jgi:Fe2+ or Zn2+ uptake regulation protein
MTTSGILYGLGHRAMIDVIILQIIKKQSNQITRQELSPKIQEETSSTVSIETIRCALDRLIDSGFIKEHKVSATGISHRYSLNPSAKQ